MAADAYVGPPSRNGTPIREISYPEVPDVGAEQIPCLPPRLGGSLWSGFSLSAQFAVVAALIVAISMTILGSWVAVRIKEGVVKHAAVEAAYYMHNFIEPHAQGLPTPSGLSPESIQRLDALLKGTSLGRKVQVIKLWAPGGVLAYSTEASLRGKVYPEPPRLKMAWTGKVQAQLEKLHDEEHEHERELGVPLIEIYAPIFALGSNEVIGVMELYEVASNLVSDIDRAQRQSWLAVATLSSLMILMLYAIVDRGSRKIAQQEAQLVNHVSTLGRLLSDNQRLQAGLTEAHSRSAHHCERLLRRIGSDLHDGPAQLIGLALLRLDAVTAPCPAPDARSAEVSPEETVRLALQEALTEIRGLSAGLTLPDLDARSLAQVVQLAVRNHERRTGETVRLEIGSGTTERGEDDPPRLPQKECIYRFVQEALNNAHRHATGCEPVVEATETETTFNVSVADDGPGFDPTVAMQQPDSLGLVGLRDRIQSIGGRFLIETGDGKGSKVSAFLKLS